MKKIEKFEDIESWKSARKLTNEIYKATSIGGFVRDFGLKDQIRARAFQYFLILPKASNAATIKSLHTF